MALHAAVTLQTIRCIKQSESSGSEPYIWPFLATMATIPGTFDTFPTAALLADSRKIIGTSLKAGSSAPLIFPGNEVSHSFLEGQQECTALLIVGLMEADDNRVVSMQAGYQAYLDELRAQLGHRMLPMKTASAAEREATIEEIKGAVKTKIENAVIGTMSIVEKGRFAIGFRDPDVFYGAGWGLWENLDVSSSGAFTLEISGVPGNHWEIDGILHVTQTEVVRCQSQLDGVAAAKQALQGLRLQVRDLQQMLDNATPAQKAAIGAAIARLNDDQLPAAEEDLRRAEYALRRCELLMETHRDVGGPLG
jgi:hypothetical protein